MKKIIIIILLTIAVTLSAAEWETEADVNLTLNQNAYSDNWEGSELGNVTWSFQANFLAQKQLSQILYSKNTLKLAFGQTHRQNADTGKWGKPEKSTDLIDFESIERFTLGLIVDPFVGARLESQFIDQSLSEEKYFNPITLTESFGAAKILYKKEKAELSSRFGAAFKQNLNSHDSIGSTNDGGLEFVTEYKTPLAQNRIKYNTRFSMYKALYFSEEDKINNDDWKSVDVEWENTFTVSISEYIMVNFYAQLIYDKQEDKAGQFRQTLALGLTYKFM